MNEKATTAPISTLIRKAEVSDKSEDALRFSQAACNVANALRCATDLRLPVKQPK